ncbi:MAG: type II toxin-antitoxin system HicB family antitoxin [Isosphaeraceae bacterium]
MSTQYTVTDGTLMLILTPAEEGGYTVTSPIDPQLVTEAETLEEAFEMAYDAAQALREAREAKAKAFPEEFRKSLPLAERRRPRESQTSETSDQEVPKQPVVRGRHRRIVSEIRHVSQATDESSSQQFPDENR